MRQSQSEFRFLCYTMKFVVIVRTAVRSLRKTLLRSCLTALGVIIGVGSVIALVSLGAGARAKIEESLTREQLRLLLVTAHTPDQRWTSNTAALLTLDDYRAIRRNIDGISSGSVYAFFQGVPAKARGRSADPVITGVEPSAFAIQGRRIVRGMTFGDFDVRRASSVCLLTETMERLLYPGGDAIGKVVTLGGHPFVTLGIVQDTSPSPTQEVMEDKAVFVPVTSLLRRLAPDARLSFTLQTDTVDRVQNVKTQLVDLMESRRGNRKANFGFHQMTDGQQQLAEGSRTMTLLLAAIAGISLLVGGIGIMNTMIVNVTERTREIGIRLAIGTREIDVAKQFLVEAIVLSVVGGVIGVCLGTATAQLLTYMNGWPTKVTLSSVALAFACSVSVGVIFGYYPARRAAKVDPIQALRSE
jgi:putative ABC transport system permease protein